MPWSITAGSWKHKLLPKEVAAWTKTSWPSNAATIMSRWNGLEGAISFATKKCIGSQKYLKDVFLNLRRSVKSMSTQELDLDKGILKGRSYLECLPHGTYL